ncbi:hypothetical protein SAMN02799633_03537 [Bacillus sp. UNCCL81]|nr:hypothetical protein SAMN02799633_03537 [Bacillus sp. UNCCL81]
MVAEVISINNQEDHQVAAIKEKPELLHILRMIKLTSYNR